MNKMKMKTKRTKSSIFLTNCSQLEQISDARQNYQRKIQEEIRRSNRKKSNSMGKLSLPKIKTGIKQQEKCIFVQKKIDEVAFQKKELQQTIDQSRHQLNRYKQLHKKSEEYNAQLSQRIKELGSEQQMAKAELCKVFQHEHERRIEQTNNDKKMIKEILILKQKLKLQNRNYEKEHPDEEMQGSVKRLQSVSNEAIGLDIESARKKISRVESQLRNFNILLNISKCKTASQLTTNLKTKEKAHQSFEKMINFLDQEIEQLQIQIAEKKQSLLNHAKNISDLPKALHNDLAICQTNIVAAQKDLKDSNQLINDTFNMIRLKLRPDLQSPDWDDDNNLLLRLQGMTLNLGEESEQGMEESRVNLQKLKEELDGLQERTYKQGHFMSRQQLQCLIIKKSNRIQKFRHKLSDK